MCFIFGGLMPFGQYARRGDQCYNISYLCAVPRPQPRGEDARHGHFAEPHCVCYQCGSLGAPSKISFMRRSTAGVTPTGSPRVGKSGFRGSHYLAAGPPAAPIRAPRTRLRDRSAARRSSRASHGTAAFPSPSRRPLEKLTPECGFSGFAPFNAAARKMPAWAVGMAHEQHAPVLADDNALRTKRCAARKPANRLRSFCWEGGIACGPSLKEELLDVTASKAKQQSSLKHGWRFRIAASQ